jgi:hypothetical protein
LANTVFSVTVENLQRDTEYDVYCFARDRGTEVEYGVTPSAGNPGNDVTMSQVLLTKRDIHTLGDSTPPIISSTTPVNGATSVVVSPVFQIVFNEDVQAGTSPAYLQFSGPSPINFDMANANNGLCENTYAQLTIILNVVTVDFSACPSTSLVAPATWYVSFAAGVFKDDSHNQNPVAAFGTSSSYSFAVA